MWSFSHVSHWSGHDFLSPIAIDMVTDRPQGCDHLGPMPWGWSLRWYTQQAASMCMSPRARGGCTCMLCTAPISMCIVSTCYASWCVTCTSTQLEESGEPSHRSSLKAWVLSSCSLVARPRPYLQQLETKNRGQISGSHGWNAKLEDRPQVWAPGHGSFSPINLPQAL